MTLHCEFCTYCYDALTVQRGATVHPKRTGGVVRAVFSEMSGERSPGSGAGGGEAGPQAVSERKSRAECSQPGQNPPPPTCMCAR